MLAAMVPHPAPPPSGSPLPPAPPPPTRRSSSKRTASSSPPLRSSSSTAWADSWSTGFSKQPSMPLLPASSLNRRALIDTTGTAQGSQSKGRGWRSPAVTPSDDDDEEDKLSDMDKVEEEWIEQVDDGFLLDNPLSHDVEDIPPTTGRPRFNSLGLSLSDLPPPASAFSSTSTTLAYPSPCTPSVATCGGSSYFPLTFTSPWSNSKEALLPPSPTLIPLSLSSPSPQPAFSPAAPRVEPASSHPLHHAKRLSMTPLSYPSELPSLTPPPPAKMQLRKGSIVDLPEMVPPPTPPLTPLGEAEDLPHVEELTVGKKEELPHGTGLGEERSARFTKMEVKRQRQHL